MTESCELCDAGAHFVLGSRPGDNSALVEFEIMGEAFTGSDGFTAVPVWVVQVIEPGFSRGGDFFPAVKVPGVLRHGDMINREDVN